jgi:hypothetical protein
MKVSELTKGLVVVFSKVPPGSYLSVGAQYLVENVGKRDVSFRNVEQGTATFDLKPMLRLAEWEVVA